MRHLNDELFRAIRIHLLIAGALMTVISVLSPSSLTVPAGASALEVGLWMVGGTSAAVGAGVWLQHVTTTRLTYTDLKIGVTDDGTTDAASEPSISNVVADSYVDCVAANDDLLRERERDLNETQRLLNSSVLVFVLGLLVMIIL